MSIRDLSPAQLLERALRLVELGRLEPAAKMLKLAAVKAPADQNIRSTLAQVEHALRSLPTEPEETAEVAKDDTASAAEAAFQQAQAAADNGELDKAAALLQVLVAANPREPRFRQLQSEVRTRRAGRQRKDVGMDLVTSTRLKELQEERDWAGAEALLRARLHEHRSSASVHVQLCLVLLYGTDNPRAALPLAKEAARLDPESLAALAVLEDSLRATGGDDQAAEVRAKAQQLAESTSQSYRATKIALRSPFSKSGSISGDAPATPQLVTTPPKNPLVGRLVLLAGLTLAAVTTAGAAWLSSQPSAVDAGPYASVLPIERALEMPLEPEIIVVVDPSTWGGMSAEDRAAALRGLQAVAVEQGHEAVFVQDAEGQTLGSIRDRLVWTGP